MGKDGETYFSGFYPIKNIPRCYHCHGRSRKILGGMDVQTNITDELAGQTAGATLEIKNQIERVQGSTHLAVGEIE